MIGFTTAIIHDNYLQRVEIRHHNIRARGTLGLIVDGRIPGSTRTLMYNSTESSISAFFDEITQTTKMGDEIIRFEEDGYLLSIYSGEAASYSFAFLTRQAPIITLLLLETDNVKYSAPQYFLIHVIDTMYYDYGVWYNEDRIARDVVISHFRGEITSKVNNGNTLFYGVGIGAIPEISILGYAPDNIIPFVYDDEDYFFWYYYDMSMLSDILEAHIDFEAFTLAEVIELLEIEVR